MGEKVKFVRNIFIFFILNKYLIRNRSSFNDPSLNKFLEASVQLYLKSN